MGAEDTDCANHQIKVDEINCNDIKNCSLKDTIKKIGITFQPTERICNPYIWQRVRIQKDSYNLILRQIPINRCKNLNGIYAKKLYEWPIRP